VRLILASASPRRLDLLARIGVIPDAVVPAEIDESVPKGELPRVHASRLAREKAEAIAANEPDALVLAADTVVAVGRRILPKVEDEETLRACMKLLSGRRHRVLTGDEVLVELTPYDLTKGRITYRFMPGRAGPPGYTG
jgi:septum formation protein